MDMDFNVHFHVHVTRKIKFDKNISKHPNEIKRGGG
jgi:hypothetical protein